MSSSTYFNGYNFVINSFVLEKIHSYKLNLNEFLLLMYFLNVDDRQFVLTDIKKHLKLSKEDILSSLNVLIEKGIVFLETKKDDKGVIREYISLAKFFELLDHNESADNDLIKKVTNYIESNCKYKLSDRDLEIVKAWVDKGFEFNLIKDSVDESMYNGSFDIRFIDNLLYKKDVKIENKVTEPLFDYNWLDEEKK